MFYKHHSSYYLNLTRFIKVSVKSCYVLGLLKKQLSMAITKPHGKTPVP